MAAKPGEVIYTCPMHPQIRQVGPGNCPICGMALEPVTPTAVSACESGIGRYDQALLGRSGACPAVASDCDGRAGSGLARPPPSTAVAATLGLPHLMSVTWSQCLQALLATPVVLWAGWPFLERGWRSFRTWNLNMFSLIGLGVSAAYVFSVYALVFPASLPAGVPH